MSYIKLPNDTNFNKKFPTWIIAFCPDTNSWFVTNERYFYFEFPFEFKTEQAGIDYFVENPSIFYGIETEICRRNLEFDECTVYLDNINAEVKVGK